MIFEESPERLKVTIPIRVNFGLLALYSFAGIIWLLMLLAVLIYLIRGFSSSIVLTIILILWLGVWMWFGKFLSGRWQYHASNREILFIDDEKIILRRPVSILGFTTSYDIRHVSPFYFSGRHQCPAFDYAFLHVYFGQSLDPEDAHDLVRILNGKCFPDMELIG